MKKRQVIASVLALSLCGAAHAAIIQIADYALGEPGSVGASAPFTALVDSIGGGAQNIPNWNGGPAYPTSVITSGLAAPGSTHALQIAGNYGGGTWYGSNLGSIDDNWAMDLWVRPNASGGTYLGASDGNGGAGLGLQFWAANSTHSGTSLGGNVLSSGSTRLLMSNGSGFLGSADSTYTLGQWYRISLIKDSGTVHYYLDGVLQDSAATGGRVNDIRLGAGYNAGASSNGAFDEMRVWQFAESDTLDGVRIEMGILVLPEPTTLAMLGIGGLLLVRRWKQK